MKRSVFRCLLLLILAFPLIAAAAPVASHYLFVWAMEANHPHAADTAMTPADIAAERNHLGLGKDFLAVFDVQPGPSFGKLVAMLPVGEAVMAHHTNYTEPPDDVLYANDWLGNSTYVFNLRDLAHPRLARKFGSVGTFGYPHSFVYLANGDTLATFQYSGGFNHAAGGLVEFDPQGKVVRTASAAVPGHPAIRPYSLAVDEKLDRVVTSSADMMGAQASHAAQVWRLSDLKLIRTMPLPPQPDWFYDTAADSSEPRVLADGKTVVVPTFHCGLFLVRDLASDHPSLQHIYDFGYRGCEVPVVVGDYLVETMQSGHAVVSLDMRDPEHPHEVSRILLPPDEYPHWLALDPGGNRLVITGYGVLDTKVRFATIDRQTGKLTLDPATIDMTRVWPDGWNGSAMPHGAVFSNP
ncbi:MAG: hypothetical protein KGL98_07535 [Gammaproteobacteria bacterium]|nr:hypothetical protein [Gammaproteobacteria bacterium]MBU6509513.1 hypothetical protein [Gammaproteobacteria bacterium]MDE1984254.1 hypothetical protein [Gammaproteobacteria bacterium]MDE2108355.1 hypothetical protein [Gammaproteobacteria bacterium]MDE2461087.1 hypothetical protein [Gammaproteobacteria bacterium]